MKLSALLLLLFVFAIPLNVVGSTSTNYQAASALCKARNVPPPSACTDKPVIVGAGEDQVTLDCIISSNGECMGDPDQLNAYAQADLDKRNNAYWLAYLYIFSVFVLVLAGPLYLLKKLSANKISLFVKIKISIWGLVILSFVFIHVMYGVVIWFISIAMLLFLFLSFLLQPILSAYILYKLRKDTKSVKTVSGLVLLLELILIYLLFSLIGASIYF